MLSLSSNFFLTLSDRLRSLTVYLGQILIHHCQNTGNDLEIKVDKTVKNHFRIDAKI